MKAIIILIFSLMAASVVQAQSVIFGGGYVDYSSAEGEDQAIFSLEYQHSPFHEATNFSARLGAALSVDTDGDTHLGAGIIGIYTFANRWFAELSVMPGYYNASNARNDLGGSYQIRSLLGLGYSFNNSNKLSLAITHKSNASTQEKNPGVNALLLRYHYVF